MKQQLALGRPLIVGVRTHGLGNPNYPGYRDHYEQAAYSVSHYLVVIGYDQSDTYILNDPGLTRGKGYHITYDQLMHAIDDLDQAYPDHGVDVRGVTRPDPRNPPPVEAQVIAPGMPRPVPGRERDHRMPGDDARVDRRG